MPLQNLGDSTATANQEPEEAHRRAGPMDNAGMQ